MNTCSGAPADQNLEDYLLGTLPENDAIAFEEHYFACPVCLARLEALQAAQGQLQRQPRTAIKTPVPWPIRFTVIAAAAAIMIAAVFTFSSRHPHQGPQVATLPAPHTQGTAPIASAAPPSLASRAASQLADLALPPFRLQSLRGQSRNPFFEAGMQAYVSKNCPAALKALSQVPAKDEASNAAHLFSGLCLMHDGDLSGAGRTLSGVADAGDSPQQEAALYYLAQIALAGNDASTARQLLSRTAALHGDFERRALAQLSQLPSGNGAH